jgi:hypothetical protein
VLEEGYAKIDDEAGISRGRLNRLDAALAAVDSSVVRASRGFSWKRV